MTIGSSVDSAAGAGAATQRLGYDGRLGELYVIFFKNLLLGIVTLGIYRFWGRTNYRRYLWSHTSYDGDRFEYTGTGGELFRGFIIAFGFFIIFILAINGLQLAFGPEHPGVLIFQLVFFLLVIFLVYASHYTALRYRLTRTLWRGIRGGLEGSAINYSLRYIAYGLLSVFTFYQFVPFATVRLWRYRVSNLFFGTAQGSFDGHGRHLYLRYLASFAGWIVAGALAAGIFFALAWQDFGALRDATESSGTMIEGSAEPSTSADAPEGPVDPELELRLQKVIGFAILAYVVWIILGGLAYLWYWAFSIRYLTAGTAIAGLEFESTVTAGRLFSLWFINILLLLVTLGIGHPIVLHRVWRFGRENITIHGRVDGALIEQSRLQPPRMGEGWLEVLDPGFV